MDKSILPGLFIIISLIIVLIALPDQFVSSEANEKLFEILIFFGMVLKAELEKK